MKKILKKLAMILSLVLAFPAYLFSFSSCSEREDILKIYNCGEYISDGSDDSMDVVSEFEKWYEEKTGRSITVEYSVFDTCETMYTQIYNKHADYDLVCPSDYTVEKMLKNDLLVPINDSNFGAIWSDSFSDENPEDYGLGENEEITLKSITNQSILPYLSSFDPGWSGYLNGDGSEFYSVPYMLGTFGLLYDRSKIEDVLGGDAGDMESWDALFGDKYAGHIYMKNSVRDAYAVTSIYNNRDRLISLSDGCTDYSSQEYKDAINEIMNEPSSETIAEAEETLKAQKKNLFAYESDEGKEDLMNGKSSAAMSFVWSCDAGYVIGQEQNTELYYSVPKEGTDLWIDNWCIPKYCGNKTAAQYFIAFMNTYDVAYENMWYCGACGPVRAVCDDIYSEITDPWSLLLAARAEGDEESSLEDFMCFADIYDDDECSHDESCSCHWHEYARMYADCIYPTDDQIARSAVMCDFGSYATDIVRMFIRVKAS